MADPLDLPAARRLLFNKQGSLSEQFVLIDLPNVLLAGFSWCLERLKMMSQSNEQMAFSTSIAPVRPARKTFHQPPEYFFPNAAGYDLAVLRGKEGRVETEPSLCLDPKEYLRNRQVRQSIHDSLCLQTTLDKGQATALCENLSRGLAFTQGPPGTGKTSYPDSIRRYANNHYRENLPWSLSYKSTACVQKQGRREADFGCLHDQPCVRQFPGRLAQGWYQQAGQTWGRKQRAMDSAIPAPSTLPSHQGAAKQKVSSLEQPLRRFETALIHNPVCSPLTGACTQGTGISESLNSDIVRWPAVRSHLEQKYRDVWRSFAEVEGMSPERALSEVKLSQKAGGFAFEYWCSGGDLDDIESLLISFDNILGKNEAAMSNVDPNNTSQIREKVVQEIVQNAEQVSISSSIWTKPHAERLALVKKWQEEIGVATLADQAVEIHRRHQEALRHMY